MHGRNVKNRNVVIHTRFTVYIPTFTCYHSTIGTDSGVILIAREHLREVGVDELTLRSLVVPKNDSCGVFVGGVIHRQPTELREDLSSLKIGLQMQESRLSGINVIVTVLDDLWNHLVGDRLVPWQTKLLMMDAQLNLESLQALLVRRRRKIVNIRVGRIISFREHGAWIFIDDPLAELVDLQSREPQISSIQEVIVILAIVESNKLVL